MADDAPVATAAEQPPQRFEVTVHAPEAAPQSLSRVDDLDLDRVPDPQQGVRLLASLDECARLVREGFEVHVLRTVPVQPLSPALITSDEDVQAWFSDQVRGVAGEGR